MEAKDTVLDGFIKRQFRMIPNKPRRDTSYWNIDGALQLQAEISFKAGYDEALGQLAGMSEECKQMGRKEVVEWLEANGKLLYGESSAIFKLNYEDLRSLKLKAGINEIV